MNEWHSTPPTNPTKQDATDRAFGTFFQRQLPSPWPAYRGDAVTVPSVTRAAPPATAVIRSRATLGVSAAVLLGLGLVLAGGPRPGRPVAHGTATSGLMNAATADGRHVQPPAPETSPTRPMP